VPGDQHQRTGTSSSLAPPAPPIGNGCVEERLEGLQRGRRDAGRAEPVQHPKPRSVRPSRRSSRAPHPSIRRLRRRAATGQGGGRGRCAIENVGGRCFAVTCRCRRISAEFGGGSRDEQGCLVCPLAPLGLTTWGPAGWCGVRRGLRQGAGPGLGVSHAHAGAAVGAGGGDRARRRALPRRLNPAAGRRASGHRVRRALVGRQSGPLAHAGTRSGALVGRD
jgi:hypothetical protein